MKKFFTFGLLVALATVMTVFTSCRDPWEDDWYSFSYGFDYSDPYYYGGDSYDQTVTYYLDGIWRGNTYWYNSWTGHNYTTSEIEFVPTSYHASSGTGYWVDYYDNYDRNYYIFNNITWTVSNGVIYVHFVQENSDVQIYDYTISNNYFGGYIYANNGNKVSFQLSYITSPYWGSWSEYVYVEWRSGAKGSENADNAQGFSNEEVSKIKWDRSVQK